MKIKYILSLILIAVLPLIGSALTVSTSYSNSTSDNDSTSNGDAGKSQAVIGSTGATVDTVGNNTAMGYRFTGYNAGRGVWNLTQQAESISQSVNVTVTWNIYAEPWETYSFALNPELHGLLKILDDNNGESGDSASFSSFNAVLKQNGSTISDSLTLSGGSLSAAGSSTVDDTATQTIAGLTGNNIFEITYTGTIAATWKIAGVQDNRTANVALWGQNGTMTGDSFADSFDEYSTTANRDGDGLFIPATVTLDAVPEPASLMMIGCGAGLIALKRRFFSR